MSTRSVVLKILLYDLALRSTIDEASSSVSPCQSSPILKGEIPTRDLSDKGRFINVI